MPDAISKTLRERIPAEAGHRCGYCLTDQRVSGAEMHIEHLIPRACGGRSEPAQLMTRGVSAVDRRMACFL